MSELSSSDNSLEMLNFEQRFVWIISEFNKHTDAKSTKKIRSPVFHFGINNDYSLFLTLYPSKEIDYIAVYLNIKAQRNSVDSCSETNKIVADYTVYLIDKEGNEHHYLEGIDVFGGDDSNDSWGIEEFIKISDLMDDTKGFLKDNKLTMYINIRLVNQISNLNIGTSEKNIELLKNFEKLFEDDEFSDVTIVASKTNFSAHRNILAYRSPVFSAMFRHNMKEKKESKVEIEDIRPEVLKEMLRFIYCGKVKDLHTLATELLAAADKYQLDDLKNVCEGELHKNLCLDNAFETLVAINHYNLDLKKYIFQFISKHSKVIFKKSEPNNSCLMKELFEKLVEDYNALKE